MSLNALSGSQADVKIPRGGSALRDTYSSSDKINSRWSGSRRRGPLRYLYSNPVRNRANQGSRVANAETGTSPEAGLAESRPNSKTGIT